MIALKVTLDTNCIIDLERNRAPAKALRALIAAGGSRVEIAVVAISASEKRSTGTYSDNFSDFEELLKRAGLEAARVLEPIGFWGITYWGHFIWDGDVMAGLLEKIHEILSPNIELDHGTYSSSRSLPPGDLDPHWRNALCDDLALWAHIYYKRDVFITGDGNFHKASKKPKLIALGANEILRPEEVGDRIRGTSSSTHPT